MRKSALILAFLALAFPAKAEDAQGFKNRLGQALSAWTQDKPGEGKLSFAEPIHVLPAGSGGFTVKVSELAWLAPTGGNNLATIDFGPSEFLLTPSQGGWTVSGHVSDMIRFVAGGQVRAAAKIGRNRIDGQWDPKREVFTKLKIDLETVGVEFASGDNITAASVKLNASSPDGSFQGVVDLLNLHGYRAADRTVIQIDQGRLELAQKPLKETGRLNFAWRHLSPAPSTPGAPQEINPTQLSLKGIVDPFDWREALAQILPAAADGSNPFGKALWSRIEPILHRHNAKLTLTDGQARSAHLTAKLVGDARFPPKAPTTGAFTAKLSGVQERLKGLSQGGSAGLLSSMAVLGILSATGIPDGKGQLDYKIDIAPDGQIMLNGKKAGGLLPKL
ncbi:exported hypothetical protein [Rhodospirillaceae bacterium LM-1]|nr:exported hypothetical protein [Rhodospirillaceae bacterium LM-1]